LISAGLSPAEAGVVYGRLTSKQVHAALGELRSEILAQP
jgi:hypothetical protein